MVEQPRRWLNLKIPYFRNYWQEDSSLNIYIASSLKNSEFNLSLERVLTRLGHNCFLPQRDALLPTDALDSENSGKLISERNIDGIMGADVILVVGKDAGNDTSWEAGFAKALSKPTILLCSKKDRVRKDLMIYFASDTVLEVEEDEKYSDERLRSALMSIDYLSGDPEGERSR